MIALILLLVIGSVLGVVIVAGIGYVLVKSSGNAKPTGGRPFTPEEADGFEAWSERMEDERD
ncbi:MAG: hypothetical protein GY898_03565 [Proteobacteria bacterium]|nr:hypothetical protein [Pseudomonadota bacterium]